LKTKEKDNHKLKLLIHITLKTAVVEDILDDKSKNIKNSFQIITPRRTMVLKAKTPEEKADWIKHLQNCIANQLEKSKSFQSNSVKSSLDLIQ